jgi:menin
MSLGTLGDLEEVTPSVGRPNSLLLFTTGVESSRVNYDNTHVYPYTYLGNYYYRCCDYKEALRSWANAARVISR